ncbi:MAG: thrombospondin type 3 repeat-containing protein [Planctomycetes bacterium]|nr:thrombospondin type 3 repeat-containing protein [Planctomycetota bacterium]
MVYRVGLDDPCAPRCSVTLNTCHRGVTGTAIGPTGDLIVSYNGIGLLERYAIDAQGQPVLAGQVCTPNLGQVIVIPTVSFDSDGDGHLETADNCRNVPNPDQADADADGFGDACDNCAGLANADQRDNDRDATGDACDLDDDNDAVLDATDNCVLVANAGQEDTDGDGVGDACEDDRDNDGVPNAIDNCPDARNADQADADSDGAGDACDDDADNDGVTNANDNCPAVPNPGQEDKDGDGMGNACEIQSLALTQEGQATPCTRVEMEVRLSNDCNVEGMSFGIGHDDAVLTAVDVVPEPVWGGSAPGFLAVSLSAEGSGGACAVGRKGVTVAMIGLQEDPRSKTVAPGLDRKIVGVFYETAAGTSVGRQSALELVSCLNPRAGSPPVSISVTCLSQTLSPVARIGRTLTVVEGNCKRRGDCNGDSLFDISDAIAVLSFLFSGGETPPCLNACDCNNSGPGIDISDAICFLSHLFLGGPAPNPPLAECP